MQVSTRALTSCAAPPSSALPAVPKTVRAQRDRPPADGEQPFYCEEDGCGARQQKHRLDLVTCAPISGTAPATIRGAANSSQTTSGVPGHWRRGSASSFLFVGGQVRFSGAPRE